MRALALLAALAATVSTTAAARPAKHHRAHGERHRGKPGPQVTKSRDAPVAAATAQPALGNQVTKLPRGAASKSGATSAPSTPSAARPAPAPSTRALGNQVTKSRAEAAIAGESAESAAGRQSAAFGATSVTAGATASAPSDGPPDGSLELFSIELDGGVGARDLSFAAGAVPGQRGHTAPAVALLGFRAGLYPFARSRTRFLDGLGVTASFLHSVAAQSAVDGAGVVVDARWSAFDVGLHERLRLGGHAFSPWVGLSFAYGRLAWSFETDGRLVGDLPSVDYRYLRPGLDLRFPLGPVTIALGGGYRALLSGGYLDERFASEARHAADAAAAISVKLPRGFLLGARGEYVHVVHTASSDPAQPAAGAIDRYAAGTLLVAWAPR